MRLRALTLGPLLGLALGLAAMAAAVGTTTVAQAQTLNGLPTDPRVAAAKEMMELSGAVKQFDEAVPLMLDQFAGSFAAMAPAKSREIREVFDQLGPRFMERKGELIDQIAELYATELTLDDLNAVVAFYKTPVGLKLAGAQPKIMRDSMQLGRRWGERLGMEVQQAAIQELRRRGINLPGAPARAQ